MALRTLAARAPLTNLFLDALCHALLDLRHNLDAPVARRAMVVVRTLAVAIPVSVPVIISSVAVLLAELEEAVERVPELEDAGPGELDVVAAHADLELVRRERQEVDGAVLAALELGESGDGMREAAAMVLSGHGSSQAVRERRNGA
jgi:hypothetical protein